MAPGAPRGQELRLVSRQGRAAIAVNTVFESQCTARSLALRLNR
jgi:hypothetical protein